MLNQDDGEACRCNEASQPHVSDRVRLKFLEWGDEFVGTQDDFVIGYIIEAFVRVPSSCHTMCHVVDFGAPCGIQRVPIENCVEVLQDDSINICENSPPIRTICRLAYGSDEGSHVLVLPSCTELTGACVGDELTWPDDRRSDGNWNPSSADLGSIDSSHSIWSLSSGDEISGILGELGIYPYATTPLPPTLVGFIGPLNRTPKKIRHRRWQHKYRDANWHSRHWTLLPQPIPAFTSLPPGPKPEVTPEVLESPFACFCLFWIEDVMDRIIEQSSMDRSSYNEEQRR